MDQSSELEASAPSEPCAAPPPRRRCVLIVDDNKQLANGLARMFKIHGYEAQVAYDGPEAIDAARDLRPDVILLDIGLPTLDGHQVARALRADESFADVIIIAISGYGQDDDRNRSLDAGFNHHLVKPLEFETVAELLAQKP
jgi:CheY-like chemotaxis protein